MHHHLHREQHYVLDVAKDLGIPIRILHHSRPTISCRDKLELLKEENEEFSSWGLNRIVKTLYFSRNGSPQVGVITPELESNLKPKDILPMVLDISRSNAERYWIDPSHVPKGMKWGTCTPFPYTSSVGKEVERIVFLDHRPIRNLEVNISVGGEDKDSYLTSMQLPYIGIYDILKSQFGDRVHFL